MSLNIKNERVHELARAAARRSGKTQTRVIEEALDAYVARLDDDAAERGARVQRILDEIDEIVTDDDRAAVRRSMDEMYDANGLPV